MNENAGSWKMGTLNPTRTCLPRGMGMSALTVVKRYITYFMLHRTMVQDRNDDLCCVYKDSLPLSISSQIHGAILHQSCS
jgi:hypothetical protein